MNFGETIPEGYIVSVRSWENDGDYGNERVTNGLTRDQARLLVMIAQLFKSRHSRPKGYGNAGMDLLDILEDFEEILSTFENPSELVQFLGFTPVLPDEDDFENPDEYERQADELGDKIYYWICDNLLGYTEYYDEQWFCRVASTITVHHNETEFTIPTPEVISISELVK